MNSYQQFQPRLESGSEESKADFSGPLEGTYQGESNMFTSIQDSSDENVHYVSIAQDKVKSVRSNHSRKLTTKLNSFEKEDIDESSLTHKPSNSEVSLLTSLT